MKIALTNCPLWTHLTPNYAVMLLGACLANASYCVVFPELEIKLYSIACDEEKTAWEVSSSDKWNNHAFVYSFMEKYKETVIKDFIVQLKEERVDVLGLNVNCSSVLATTWLVAVVKEALPRLKIILGGPMSFSAPEQLVNIPGVDAVCLGEGDVSLVRFLDAMKGGAFPSTFDGFMIPNIDGSYTNGGFSTPPADISALPFPDYSQINLEAYASKNTLPTTLSRGCIQRCSYCAESPHFGKFRHKSADSILREFSHHLKKTGSQNLRFLLNDSVLNGNLNILHELSDRLIEAPLPVTFGGMAVARKEMDLALLTKLKKAGCTELSFGIESGSQAVLDMMKKKFHTPESTIQVLKDCREAGIWSTVFIIVGFPGETEEFFYETLSLLRNIYSYVDNIMVNRMLLLPGAPIMNNPEAYGVDTSKGTGADFYTRDGLNTPYIRKKRQEILITLFQSKTTLMGSMDQDGEDSFKELRQRDQIQHKKLNELESHFAELTANLKERNGEKAIYSLWENDVKQSWITGGDLDCCNSILISHGNDPFLISPEFSTNKWMPQWIKYDANYELLQAEFTVQLFWLEINDNNFSESKSSRIVVKQQYMDGNRAVIYFPIGKTASNMISKIRIDPMECPGQVRINDILIF